MLFNEVIGQEAVKERLTHMVDSDNIPHALLLHGKEGVGKLPLALALTQYIFCNHRHNGEACGTCPSCTKIRKLSHPDLHFVFPVIKKDSDKSDKVFCDKYIDEWRQTLIQQPYFGMADWLRIMKAEKKLPRIYSCESDELIRKLSIKSFEGGYKVVMMWKPELMETSCANKLLKIFEEPPAKTLFIFVSDEPTNVLSTVISRTQPIEVPPLKDEDIVTTLEEKRSVEHNEALRIAHIANGSLLKAYTELTVNPDDLLYFDLFVLLMRQCYMRNVKELKTWSEQLAEMGREKQKNFLQYAQHMVRESFTSNFKLPELNYMTQNEAQFVNKFGRFINERNVIKIMDELAFAQRDIEQNANAKIVMFDLALKMIILLIQ